MAAGQYVDGARPYRDEATKIPHRLMIPSLHHPVTSPLLFFR
jgi:hypothetical protein